MGFCTKLVNLSHLGGVNLPCLWSSVQLPALVSPSKECDLGLDWWWRLWMILEWALTINSWATCHWLPLASLHSWCTSQLCLHAEASVSWEVVVYAYSKGSWKGGRCTDKAWEPIGWPAVGIFCWAANTSLQALTTSIKSCCLEACWSHSWSHSHSGLAKENSWGLGEAG